MREIPSLEVLCLRAIGSHACSAEETFCPLTAGATDKNNNNSNNNNKSMEATPQLSTASRLLRSYHRRPVWPPYSSASDDGNNNNNNDNNIEDVSKDHESTTTATAALVDQIPMRRSPCIGHGSARRWQASQVDLHHPVVGIKIRPFSTTTTATTTSTPPFTSTPVFIMQYGNPALDALQSYIDALTEMGRMDDTRLGRHFFEEYKHNIRLGNATMRARDSSGTSTHDSSTDATLVAAAVAATPSKKRRRGGSYTPPPPTVPVPPLDMSQQLPLASLSLHNCSLADDTIAAMIAADLGPYLAVLDLTGIHGLTDDLCCALLTTCPNLQRLSLKNSRRLTVRSLQAICVTNQSLVSLDIGGCFNMTVPQVLQVLTDHKNPATSSKKKNASQQQQRQYQLSTSLTQLHASGLGWNDEDLEQLFNIKTDWTALSLGFSTHLTAASLRQNLQQAATTLHSLALPFCEPLVVVDNALMGMLGRNLPALQVLDVRGNHGLTTLTGWYDGRASADLPPQALTVLGRYSSLTEASVEETMRIHPLETVDLHVVLDGSGTGLAIGYQDDDDCDEKKAEK